MWLLQIIAVCLGCLHTVLAVEPPSPPNPRGRIIFDLSSCLRVGANEYEAIRSSFRTAQEWAQQAFEQFHIPWEKRGNGDPLKREAIYRNLERLTGSKYTTSPSVRELLGYLDRIRAYDIPDPQPSMWSTEWENERNKMDLEVFCNANHIILLTSTKYDRGGGYQTFENSVSLESDDSRPILLNHWDKRRLEYLGPNEDLVKMKYGDCNSRTVLTPAGKSLPTALFEGHPAVSGRKPVTESEIPGTVTFDPAVVKRMCSDAMCELNLHIIKQAAQSNTARKIAYGVENFIGSWKNKDENHGVNAMSPADSLNTLEHTAIIILASSPGGGSAGLSAYTWRGCIRGDQRDVRNSASVAWLALVVQLILKYGYDLDDKGNVVKLTPDPDNGASTSGAITPEKKNQ